MSETLTEFLLARIAEDERAARAAETVAIPRVKHLGGGKWGERYNEMIPAEDMRRDVVWFIPEGQSSPSSSGTDKAGSALFARFNPARVLADVDAKRRIAEIHRPSAAESGFLPYCEGCWEDGGMDGAPTYPCRTLRALALPYADHPDYREEWKP